MLSDIIGGCGMETQTLQNIANPRRLSSASPAASIFYEGEEKDE